MPPVGRFGEPAGRVGRVLLLAHRRVTQYGFVRGSQRAQKIVAFQGGVMPQPGGIVVQPRIGARARRKLALNQAHHVHRLITSAHDAGGRADVHAGAHR